jgi:putative hydrolase of the HAD superfamily
MFHDVRAVLFDAVGTVLQPHPPAALAYYEAGRRFASQLCAAEVTKRYEAAFRRQEALDQAAGHGHTDEAREAERWRQIVLDVFDDVPNIDPLFEYLWAHFASPTNWRVFPDVAPAWDELERRGLALGLASNFDARLAEVCRGHEPLAQCRRIFVSSRLKVRKPHRAFFAAIEQSLNLPARQILLVGDNLQTDYQAALAAGWEALLISRNSPPPIDVISIADMTQLPSFLGR